MEVTVAMPEVDSLTLRKTYPGYTEATQKADVVARVNGHITRKYFDDGQYVAAGAPLFEIESTTYRDQVARAEAQLQTAIATRDYATREYQAMKKALESDAVSKMSVIQAESAANEAEAAVKNAHAALQTARTTLGYCTIRAPFSGHVGAPTVVVGDYVAGEASPVVVTKIVNDKDIYVNFSVEDSQYLQLVDTKAGKQVDLDHVEVNFGDSILTKFYGPLNYQAPDVDRSTGTIRLRIRLQNPDGELKSGMYANVLLPYAVEPHAVVIKDASIGTDQLGKYVYLVNDSNRVVYTPVVVGELYQDSLRIISSGLKPTDRYVTQALLKVRDGMEVKPVLSAAPAKTAPKTATAGQTKNEAK